MNAVPGAHALRRPRAWPLLLLVCVLALLLRGFLILNPPADFFERGETPHEEILRGIAAEEIVRGPLAPIQDYQINNFWGGSLVASYVAAPFFWVFGPKVIALRASSLVWSLGAIVLVFLVLDRFLNRRAAWIGALLMAFAPPGYVLIGCTVYGTHLESNTVALALVFLYLEWVHTGRGGVLRTALLGAAAGFALWFGYGLLLVLVSALVFELARDRWFALRARFLAPFTIGFLIGFAPWIRYNVLHRFTGFDVYETDAATHVWKQLSSGKVLQKVYGLFVRDWAESFWFQGSFGVDGVWLARPFVLILCVLLGYALWRLRHIGRSLLASLWKPHGSSPRAGPAELAVCFLALFLGAYFFSDFHIGDRSWVQNFRYLMPLWPFVVLIVASLASTWLARAGNARRTTLAVLGGFVLVCAVGSLRRADPERAAEAYSARAWSDKWFARFLVLRFGGDSSLLLPIVERLESRREPAEQETMHTLLAAGLGTFANVHTTSESEEVRRRAYANSVLFLRTRVGAAFRSKYEKQRVPEDSSPEKDR